VTLGGRNRRAALVTGLVGLLAVGVAALVVGADGAWSALLGAGLVLAFLSAGSLPFVVAGDTTQGRGGVAFVVLGLTYALRLVLALVVLKLASRADWVHGTVVGLSVIACALAWAATMVVLGVSRRHQPTLDL
jgi:hypothetical protein